MAFAPLSSLLLVTLQARGNRPSFARAVGIDELGVEIEEPFCILPLLPLCRTIVNDVKIAHTAELTESS